MAAAADPSKLCLFDLPVEIRQLIYRHYVATDIGYKFNPKSRKFLMADGSSIDTSLMLTCRAVAAESRDLGVQENTLIFSTYYDDETRLRAARLDLGMKHLDWRRKEMLTHARTSLDLTNARQVLATDFPQFIWLLDAPIHQPLDDPLDIDNQVMNLDQGEALEHTPEPEENLSRILQFRGQVHSMVHRFVSRGLRLAASAEETFTQELERGFLKSRHCTFDFVKLANLDLPAWSMPTTATLAKLSDALKPVTSAAADEADDGLPPMLYRGEEHQGFLNEKDDRKYHISAAAICIDYLQALSVASRRQLRKLVLCEDRLAVSDAPSHAQGLIPFCLENPRLRIERRASIWRNVFQSTTPESSSLRVSTHRIHTSPADSKFPSRHCNPNVCRWVLEAMALESLGMPVGSFRLILDCESTPDQAHDVFKYFVRESYTHWVVSANKNETLLGLTWDDQTSQQFALLMRTFFLRLEAMRELIAYKSVAECNFDPGTEWKYAEIMSQSRRSHREHRDWAVSVFERQRHFELKKPLPLWVQILSEDVVPSTATD